MTIEIRQYEHPADYKRVDEFLLRHYQPGNRDCNWIEPAWEYMHAHPFFQSQYLGRIGIWEDDGEIVAVVHYEWHLGEAFFQFHPAYRHLRGAMLAYAEEHLFRKDANGRKYLSACVNDNDKEFLRLVRERGYKPETDQNRPLYEFTMPQPFPAISLPPGFEVKSLADECSWRKVNRVLHRGFDHDGEPDDSAEELASRRKMFETPNGRLELKIVTVAPDGNFASFCGMFYQPIHKYAYVEPVATDPTYRRLGLGKAAVLEGIRRCAELGASVAFVGSDQEFYTSFGFTKVYSGEYWGKTWQ